MKPSTKESQLQIRVTRKQKLAIRRAAELAGLDMSEYVLRRVLSVPAHRFQDVIRDLAASAHPSFALAALHDLLASLAPLELREAVAVPPQAHASPYIENYLAAMVETACAQNRVEIPSWVSRINPLPHPVFGSGLESLRLHLLTNSPPAFRRRNIFVDTTIGDRV
jgi:uncharacterized protein (DUF1778 family)